MWYCILRYQTGPNFKGRHTRGDLSLRLVLVTSRGVKSHRVNWLFLLQNLLAGAKAWTLRQIPGIQTGLNFWGKFVRLLPKNASCELFVGQVPSC